MTNINLIYNDLIIISNNNKFNYFFKIVKKLIPTYCQYI